MREDQQAQKKEIVNKFIEKGILLGSDLLNKVKDSEDIAEVYRLLNEEVPSGAAILNADTNILMKNGGSINWAEMERAKAHEERGKSTPYSDAITSLVSKKEVEKPQDDNPVTIVYSYKEENRKRSVLDFVDYFNSRLLSLEKTLKRRSEIKNQISSFP